MHDFTGEPRQAHIDVATDVEIPVGIEKSNPVRILSIFHPLSSRIVVPARLCSQTKKYLKAELNLSICYFQQLKNDSIALANLPFFARLYLVRASVTGS